MRQTYKHHVGVRSCRFIVLAVYLTIGPTIGFCQSANPAPALPPLLPAAQGALNKGIIAAKVPDYLLAIRYFEDARKLAPDAPIIYFNLGLAESKIPGRELRAMAWFGAYLAANPNAPNAAVVKEQITVVEVRHQSNVSRLIKTVQDAAKQTSDFKDENLRFVAKLWAEAGDITAAVKITDLIGDTLYKRRAQRDITDVYTETGMPTQNAGALIALLRECSDCRIKIDEAKAQAKAGTGITYVPDTRVFEWLYTLNGGCRSSVDRMCTGKGLVNTEPFLDLADYLKSLPPSDNPQTVFASLYGAANEIVTAQVMITRMLNQQAKR
jgi:hypothetical protein